MIYSRCRFFAFVCRAFKEIFALRVYYALFDSPVNVIVAGMYFAQDLTTKWGLQLHSVSAIDISCLDTGFILSMWILLTEILVRTYEIRATAVKHVRIFVLWNLFSKYSGVVYT